VSANVVHASCGALDGEREGSGDDEVEEDAEVTADATTGTQETANARLFPPQTDGHAGAANVLLEARTEHVAIPTQAAVTTLSDAGASQRALDAKRQSDELVTVGRP
jgi:hypothetical protein